MLYVLNNPSQCNTPETITVPYYRIHHSAILRDPSQCYTTESIIVLYSGIHHSAILQNHHSALLQSPSQCYTTESVTVLFSRKIVSWHIESYVWQLWCAMCICANTRRLAKVTEYTRKYNQCSLYGTLLQTDIDCKLEVDPPCNPTCTGTLFLRQNWRQRQCLNEIGEIVYDIVADNSNWHWHQSKWFYRCRYMTTAHINVAN